jgi:hypothetical protein
MQSTEQAAISTRIWAPRTAHHLCPRVAHENRDSGRTDRGGRLAGRAGYRVGQRPLPPSIRDGGHHGSTVPYARMVGIAWMSVPPSPADGVGQLKRLGSLT